MDVVTMDLGVAVVIIAGAAAIVPLIKAITTWIAPKRAIEVKIQDKLVRFDGKKSLTDDEADKIIKQITSIDEEKGGE
jgi:hypothetical protein